MRSEKQWTQICVLAPSLENFQAITDKTLSNLV